MTGGGTGARNAADQDRAPSAYVERIVTDECAKVVSAPGHQANDTLNRAAAALGKMEGAGWLKRAEAERRLEEAAAQRCDDTSEAMATIKSGLDWGRKHPRAWRQGHSGARHTNLVNASPPAIKRPSKTGKMSSKRKRALVIWQGAGPAPGTAVETYLQSRRLAGPIPETIKFSASESLPGGGKHPAMIARIENAVTGAFCGVQRTALASDGMTKAKIKTAKATLGEMDGGAVILGQLEKADTILEGEGVETVLSASQCTGLPGIATLGLARLGKPALPPDANIITLAERGTEGGALKGAERRAAEGRTVKIAVPPDGAGNDFNDMLQNIGTEAVKAAIDNAQPYEPEKSYEARCLGAIEPQPIDWLWPDRFALGKLNLIAGQPGLGKSQLTLLFAATVSTGGTWPDGTNCPQGNVILITCEDDMADTVVPRLDALGANLNAVHCLDAILTKDGNRMVFDLQSGIGQLRQFVHNIGDVRLIVIDPVSAYSGRADTHKNSDVRGLLMPLQELAVEAGAAIVLVSHLNKGALDGSASSRVSGSGAYVAVCRSAWMVGTQSSDLDDATRILAPIKNNIGNDKEGFSYVVEGVMLENGIATCRAHFTSGPFPITADDLVNKPQSEPAEPSKLAKAEKFLQETLSSGWVATKNIKAAAEAGGHSWRTIERAKKPLGIETQKQGLSGKWEWRLPDRCQQTGDLFDAEDRQHRQGRQPESTISCGGVRTVSSRNRPSPDQDRQHCQSNNVGGLGGFGGPTSAMSKPEVDA